MREKVIAINGISSLDRYHVKEVNVLLEQGWSVKSVTAAATNDNVTAIFVLQKNEE